jgi:hypothetical protein
MTSNIRGPQEKRYNRARYVPRCTRIPAGVFWMRQVIRMSKVIRLETGEEPEWFFDLELENRTSHQTCEMRRTEFFEESAELFDG